VNKECKPNSDSFDHVGLWNDRVRLHHLRADMLNGTWQAPEAQVGKVAENPPSAAGVERPLSLTGCPVFEVTFSPREKR
jgi:hypothetical protein